jgi:AraC-like DNA-binding protein
MLYLTRVPAAPLDRAIAQLWYCQSPARPFAYERVLPLGSAQLVINLKEDETRTYGIGRDATPVQRATSGSILSGVGTRFQIIDTAEQEHVVGVTFRPGGTLPFFREPASLLQDVDVPLDALWSRGAAVRLREQLLAAADPESGLDVLEAAFAGAWQARAVHPAVAYAVGDFRRHADVARIAAVSVRVGLSARRVGERFEVEVGITPKRYCRLLRFQSPLQRAHPATPPAWSDVALAAGYYDQAHFIRDFQAFSGLTPTAYRANRTDFANHVTFLQSAPA